jgi:hypothetical protein
MPAFPVTPKKTVACAGWNFNFLKMNPFWDNIYDDAKDRRYGALFFTVILILLGTLAVTYFLRANLDEEDFRNVCIVAGPILGLITVVYLWRRIRRALRDHNEQCKYSNLSRDELAKARSKLKTRMKIEPPRNRPNGVRRRAERRPDTDLKY